MQSIITTVVRPAAARVSYRQACYVNVRTMHTGSSSAAQAQPSSKPKVGSSGHDLYVWGGGQGWFARSTQTSTTNASRSPLTSMHLRPTAVESPDGTGFRDISFGHKHGAFITGSGDLYTYGIGPALGHGPDVQKVEIPRKVEGLPAIVEVKCGAHHTIALGADGEVYTFGKGDDLSRYYRVLPFLRWINFLGSPSALGTPDGLDAPRPVRINIGTQPGDQVVQIAAGSKHNMVRTANGKLYGWGLGDNGRLGTGGSANERTPVMLDALAGQIVKHVSCGSSFNAALTNDGQVYTWGRNEKGQLGLGPGMTLDQYAMESAPVHVQFDSDRPVTVSKVACAYKHTLSITSDGQLWMWGQSLWFKPFHLKGDDGSLEKDHFVDIAGGQGFSAAVRSNGELVTFGSGSTGCLGHGSTSNVSPSSPAQVRGFGATPAAAGADNNQPWLGRVVKIFAGHNHCAALATKTNQ